MRSDAGVGPGLVVPESERGGCMGAAPSGLVTR
jgi:hypothetical protein